jgi:homoserine dehydrogenase
MKYETRGALARKALIRHPLELHERTALRPSVDRIRVGIVGFGTVGRATAEIISQHSELINRRSGIKLEVAAVCRRSKISKQDAPSGVRCVVNWREIVSARDIDIVVETMGGTDESLELILASLAAGKPVVTANKRLLAEHGESLFALATARNLPIGFEASVAASIPILRVLQQSMTGDRVFGIRGILNGTCNYILTEMESRGIEFDQALLEAQRAGYAEADPSLDIDGFDARDKLCILARMAFGGRLQVSCIPTSGIRQIRACDIEAAKRIDRTIRLVASAEETEAGLAVSVRPRLVSRRSMLAQVDGVNNAVVLTGEKIGTQMFYGRGAGGDATGAAVVSDLIEIAGELAGGRLNAKRIPGFAGLAELRPCQDSRDCRWYLRVSSSEEATMSRRVTELMTHHNVGIDLLPQDSRLENHFAFVTSPTSEASICTVVEAINGLASGLDPVLAMPIE